MRLPPVSDPGILPLYNVEKFEVVARMAQCSAENAGVSAKIYGERNIRMNKYAEMSPLEVRKLIRSGEIDYQTSGMCAGYAQANLVVLPREEAFDFLLFAQRNPTSCPILEVSDVGSRSLRFIAEDADIVLVAYGTTSRIARSAMRKCGYRKGYSEIPHIRKRQNDGRIYGCRALLARRSRFVPYRMQLFV